MPKFEPKTDDITLLLELFERQAKVLQRAPVQWVAQLIGVLLPNEISSVIARAPEESAKDYDFVKNLLLQRFRISPEKFRQLFTKHHKAPEKSWHDFYHEIKTYFEGWLTGMKIKTFEQLKELIIVDQIKKQIPLEFRDFYLDQWANITSPENLVEKVEEFEDTKKRVLKNQLGRHHTVKNL